MCQHEFIHLFSYLRHCISTMRYKFSSMIDWLTKNHVTKDFNTSWSRTTSWRKWHQDISLKGRPRPKYFPPSLTTSATSGRELFSRSLLTNSEKVMTDALRDSHYISKRGQWGEVKKRKGTNHFPHSLRQCPLFARNYCTVLRTQRTIYYYRMTCTIR